MPLGSYCGITSVVWLETLMAKLMTSKNQVLQVLNLKHHVYVTV